MFEKIKDLFKGAPKYTTSTTRVHKKQHARANHVHLVIGYKRVTKEGTQVYSNACQIPFGTTDEQQAQVAEMLWSGLKTKYDL